MMDTLMIIIVTAAISALATWTIMRSVYKARLESQEKLALQAQANYDRALKEMKETVVASMTAETERLNPLNKPCMRSR